MNNEKQFHQMMRDLQGKIADDVMRAVNRTLQLIDEDQPSDASVGLALMAACTALAMLAEVLEHKYEIEPREACLLLACMMSARGVLCDGETDLRKLVLQASRDIKAMTAAGILKQDKARA